MILQMGFSKIVDAVQLIFFVVSGEWCGRSCTQASILLPAGCVVMDKSLHLDTLHFLPLLKGEKAMKLLSVVLHTFNSSTVEAEADGSLWI